jgi:hypothetical protein
MRRSCEVFEILNAALRHLVLYGIACCSTDMPESLYRTHIHVYAHPVHILLYGFPLELIAPHIECRETRKLIDIHLLSGSGLVAAPGFRVYG